MYLICTVKRFAHALARMRERSEVIDEHHMADLLQKFDDVMKEMHQDKAAYYSSEDQLSREKLADLKQQVLATQDKVSPLTFVVVVRNKQNWL